MINLQQIRAARAMLGLSQHQLAEKAAVSIGTLNNIERGVQTDSKYSTLKAIQQALEAAGAEFINDAQGRIGVAWSPARQAETPRTVLIVDDSNADRSLFRHWLDQSATNRYTVIEATNAKDGYDVFTQSQPDCIVLDFNMYGLDGFQLLVKLKRETTNIPPIVFVTGMPNPDIEKNIRAQGIHAYLNKNTLTQEHFCTIIANAIR